MSTRIATAVVSAFGLWLAGSQTFGAGLPSASTLAASAITSTNAQLNGTFGANGATTSVYFDIGLTTNNYQRLFLTTIDASTVSTTLSATTTALTPGQTYHYRAAASNSFGITLGNDVAFTLLAGPPVAVTEAPRDVTQTAAQLRGQASLRGGAGVAYFDFGTTTNYGQVLGLTNLPDLVATYTVTNTVSSLSPGGVYHYRMVCSNTVAVTFGADVSFMTGTSAPPSAVTLPADSVTNNSARLNGQVNPNGSTTTVTFEYGTTTNYGTTAVLGSIGNGFSALGLNVSVFGLSASTLYHFRIGGQSAAGTNYGADMMFTTLAGSSAAPTVTTLDATNITTSSATVNGQANPNGASTTVYFELGTTTNYGTYSGSPNIGSGTLPVSFNAGFGALSPATLYHYRMVGYNPNGTNYGADATFTTLAGIVIAPSAVNTNAIAPGHRVWLRQAAPSFGNLTNVTAAEALLGLASNDGAVAFDAYDVGVTFINYSDYATSPPPQGHFDLDRDVHVIPGNTAPATDQDNYAMECTGYIYIPVAGSWTFVVNSDEGFRLRMGAADAVIMEFTGTRTNGDTFATVSVPSAGYYPYRLVYFELTGGSKVEFFANGPGQPSFMLVGDPFSSLLAYHDIEVPTLNIAGQAGEVVLSWPLKSGVGTLQSNTNLTSSASWITVSPAPVVSGGQYVVTNNDNAAAQFYRLKLP